MAVTIKKKNLTIVSLVTRLFTAEDLVGKNVLHQAHELESQGFKLRPGISTFAIEFDSGKQMMTVHSVTLNFDTVQLAIKKKLGHTVKGLVKNKVNELIHVAYQKSMDGVHPQMTYQPKALLQQDVYKAVMAKYHANGTGNKVAAIKEFRKLTGASLKDSKDMIENWIDAEKLAAGSMPIVDDIKMESTSPDTEAPEIDLSNNPLQQQTVYGTELNLKVSPIPLKEAQKLNQPVCGTSGGSIYHVIAIGDSCVVAARIKNNNEIALRAELRVHPNSTEGQKAKSGLAFAGLDKKPAGHFSLHLDPEDFNMVKRSIGSTLMAMSIPFWGVCTDLNILQGVGK